MPPIRRGEGIWIKNGTSHCETTQKQTQTLEKKGSLCRQVLLPETRIWLLPKQCGKNSTRLKKLLKLSKTASRTDVLDLTVLQYVEMGELSCLAHPTSCLVISTSVESLTRQLIRYKGSMQWFLVTKSDLLVIC